jgi:hypothetical protein
MTDAPTPSIMRGAGKCPKCACRKVGRAVLPDTNFYARAVEICANCGTAWEPFNPADLLDDDDHLSSFKEPCDNCAFRSGSPEQADTGAWKKMIEKLGESGRFYCHKGVPINPQNDDGFDYPRDKTTGQTIPTKMRLCRGYLRMLNAQWNKRKEAA